MGAARDMRLRAVRRAPAASSMASDGHGGDILLRWSQASPVAGIVFIYEYLPAAPSKDECGRDEYL